MIISPYIKSKGFHEMGNMFKTAPVIVTKKTPAAKDKLEVAVPALDDYASVAALIAALEAVLESLEGEVKDTVRTEFVNQGQLIKKRPDNFRAISKQATASCELRKRSVRSVLSDAEVEELKSHNIPVAVNEVQKAYFVINPDYAGDDELLTKVSNALQKVKGLPTDFIQHIEGKTTFVADEKSIDAVFAANLDQHTAKSLMSMVTTLALKPVLRDNDLTMAFESIKEMIAE